MRIWRFFLLSLAIENLQKNHSIFPIFYVLISPLLKKGLVLKSARPILGTYWTFLLTLTPHEQPTHCHVPLNLLIFATMKLTRSFVVHFVWRGVCRLFSFSPFPESLLIWESVRCHSPTPLLVEGITRTRASMRPESSASLLLVMPDPGHYQGWGGH